MPRVSTILKGLVALAPFVAAAPALDRRATHSMSVAVAAASAAPAAAASSAAPAAAAAAPASGKGSLSDLDILNL